MLRKVLFFVMFLLFLSIYHCAEDFTGTFNVSTTEGDTPMWTPESNPKTCTNLKEGYDETCSTGWVVNATVDGYYNLSVVFSPTTLAPQNQSNKLEMRVYISKGVIPTTRDPNKPFWTPSANPNTTCVNMKEGYNNESCFIEWIVNATRQGYYHLFVDFHPSTSSPQTQTNKTMIEVYISKGVIPTSRDENKPFWSHSSNPNTDCTNMKEGYDETCSIGWLVESVLDGNYYVFVDFSPLSPTSSTQTNEEKIRVKKK